MNPKPITKRVGTHLIITGQKCRFCSKLIPDSIAHLYGTPANGYVCPDCLVKHRADLAQLGQELRERSTINIDIPGDPHPCVICGNKELSAYRLVRIDGRLGFICVDPNPKLTSKCEALYVKSNREKIGPQLQYRLKLR